MDQEKPCLCYDVTANCPRHGARCASCGELLADEKACVVLNEDHARQTNEAKIQ